jgi:hypothetical protein
MKVAAYRLPELQKRVDSFNRKAVKWGLPEMGYTITKEWADPVYKRDADGILSTPREIVAYLEWAEVEFTGEVPKLNGWAVHSRVEPSDVAGQNFVFTAPQFAPVERLRYTSMACEHCNMDRGRKLVYLLQNQETGEQRLVGRTCVTDFIQADAEALLSYLGSLQALSTSGEDEEEAMRNAPREALRYPLDLAIAEAIIVIRKRGYTSKKAANAYNEKVEAAANQAEYEGKEFHDKTISPTTANMAVQTQYSRGQKIIDRNDYYTEAEIEAAAPDVEAFKAYVSTLNTAGNDFLYNVALACQQSAIKYTMFGYIAAAVNMWIVTTAPIATPEPTQAPKANNWIGTVGQRMEFHGLTITRVYLKESAYGTTYITTMEDKDGNSVVWFASKAVGDVGATLNLKATVKAHDDFKGRKQTVITRGASI